MVAASEKGSVAVLSAAMAMDKSNMYLVKKGEFVTRSIAGETILVPVRGQIGDLDAIYNLNAVGTFIWGRINGSTNVRQIADAVAAEFEVTTEEAKVDTMTFVEGLEAAGLIGLVGSGEV